MSRLLRIGIAITLIGLLLSLLGVWGVIVWAGDPLAHAVITIDGNAVTLARLQGGAALLAIGGVLLIVALVLLLPLAIVLPLLALALALGLAVIAIAGTAALVLSPLILLGWLIWRLARPARPARAAPLVVN